MASAIKEEVDCHSTVMTALFILAALQSMTLFNIKKPYKMLYKINQLEYI